MLRLVGLWLVALCVLALVPVGARAFSSSVYVPNSSANETGVDDVSQYDLGVAGVLSAKTPLSVVGGSEPFAVAVSPDGNSVYVANFDTEGAGGVSQYTAGAGGALSPMTPATIPAGNSPSGIAITLDGKSVYVANRGRVRRAGSRSTALGRAVRSQRWRRRPSPPATDRRGSR